MLDVRRLRLLRDLETHGSLVAVAGAIGISTSAVSQQLAKLESDVGVRLLERSGRNVHLTPTGRMLAARVREIDDILEAAEGELDGRRSSVQGVVRFAAFSSYALRNLPDLLARLVRLHPDVVIEFTHVEPTEALSAVAGRRADVAIADAYPGTPQELGSQLVSVRLYREYFSARLPREIASTSELANLPWVLEPQGTPARDWAMQLCRSAGFEPIVQFESPDLRLHADLVDQGMAAGFLPASVGDKQLVQPGHSLDGKGVFEAGCYRDVYAVTRRGAHTRRAVGAFLDVLVGPMQGSAM